MSKANPAVIGGFVVGAIALVVIGLLVFGGANWFAERNTVIAYFPGSVRGLRVGAPVDFRGVTIGQVTEIKVLFDPEDVSARIPVVMEFDPAHIEMVGAEPDLSPEEDTERLIEAGFRAQLQSQSLLTGLLFVNLDFHEDAPLRLVGGDQPYPEIPTIPSGMERIEATAGEVADQLPTMIAQLTDILTQLNATFSGSSGDLEAIMSDVAAIAEGLREGTPKVQEAIDNASGASADVRRAAATLERILETNSDAIGSLIDEWTVTASSVRRLAEQVDETIAENREGLRDFTQTGLYEYTGLAQDAQRMVDQITRVTEELERDPARFLFGDRAEGIQAE